MCIAYDPEIPLLGISSKEITGLMYKANYTGMFTVALFN